MKDYTVSVAFGQYKAAETWEVCASSVSDLDEAAKIRMGKEHKHMRTMTILSISACQHEKGRVV